jgi:hypothetical protein
LITWSLTDGDDRVNAKDELDNTATTIAAPAMAARTPLAMRRGLIGFLQAAQRLAGFTPDLNLLTIRQFGCFIKRIMKNLTHFSAE